MASITNHTYVCEAAAFRETAKQLRAESPTGRASIFAVIATATKGLRDGTIICRCPSSTNRSWTEPV